MREIKFRAWNKKRKRMYEVLHLHLERSFGSDGIWATVKGRDIIEDKDIHLQVQPKDIEIAQYTGLKDKNRKEIYEGDLLRINPYGEEEYTSEVKTIEGSPFCIETPWDGECDYFMLAAYVRHFGNVEVIGNIYEKA